MSLKFHFFFVVVVIHPGNILSSRSSKTSGGLYSLRGFLKVAHHALVQVLSASVAPQSSGINIPWELVRHAHSQAPFRLTHSETGGWSPAICVLTSPPDDSDTH